jgi:lipopolysaccharide exporter
MTSLKTSVARGAAWMVLYRLFDRSLGLISTLVLARLLVPADFGLVAMATSFTAILELFNAFGLDVALIQRRDAKPEHFNTAWTLNVIMGLIIAAGLLALAWPLSLFYRDPRLVAIICVLACGTAAQGFENIGVVAFRKEMNFKREFRYFAAKRLLSFCASIIFAFTLKNYWALALGILTGRLVGVVISYLVHPFRPRFSLSTLTEFMHFSKWIFAQNILFFLKDRSSDFIVGRIAGAHAVGVLSLSVEISSLPGTELVAPINRAALPAYAKTAHDPVNLGRQYLTVTSLVALIITPCVAGIGALGTIIVALLLGPKWHEAALLINLIAFVGIVNVMANTAHPALLAVGKPKVFAKITTWQVSLQIPALIVLTYYYGVVGAAWGYLAAAVGVLPFSLWFIQKSLGLPPFEFVKQVWRPLIAATTMYGCTKFAMPALDIATLASSSALKLLAIYAPLGASIYLLTVTLLWLASGRPEGAELIIARQIASRWQRARAGA